MIRIRWRNEAGKREHRAREELRLPSRREPHLVLWFVVVTTIGLLLAGGGILIVVERTLTGQAERHAVERARVAANALLDRQVRAGDLSGALSPARRAPSLSALRSRLARGGIQQ